MAGELLPAGQLLQLVLLVVYLPAAQEVQLVLAAAEVLPAAQPACTRLAWSRACASVGYFAACMLVHMCVRARHN